MRFFKRVGGRWLLALSAALAATLVAASLSSASSHREAPGTSRDPTADNTDVYVFRAQDAPNTVTLVSNWIPFEDPAGGPNFYRFDDHARYYISIDNKGDGKYHIRYLFKFKTHYRQPGTFLYGLGGPITSPADKNLNVIQTYTVVRQNYRNGSLVSSQVLGRNLPTPPDNVGPKTTPNYAATAQQAISSLRGGGKVFAGQRNDPFFASLGRIFDTVNLTGAGLGNQGGGVDDLAGYAVHSIVMQLPIDQVTRDQKPVAGPKAQNAVIGVWSSTDRRGLSVSGGGGGAGWHQVSRLGNPLVNELIIPLQFKDQFNQTQPANDGKNYGAFVLKPGLAAALNALYPQVHAPTDNRTDIVQAVLQGVPGLNAFPGKNGQLPTDTIKINLGIPPTASPNRLGVLGKDLQGYPNGRRLTDDVVDIDLQVVAGALKGNKVPLGDGVDANPVSFLAHFPYLSDPGPGANPKAGLGSQLKSVSSDGTAAAAPTSGPRISGGGSSVSTGGWIAIIGGAVLLAAAAFTVGMRRRVS
jgi:hypothetical protein